MSYSHIIFEEGEGGVALVTVNRPDKLNAIDSAMFSALSEASAAVAERPGVRAVVLSGNGRGFCANLSATVDCVPPGVIL